MIYKSKKCRFCEAELSSADDNCPSCGLSQRERTLVDWEIRKLIERDIIVVDPILNMEEQLSPVGIDLRLDVYFRELLHMKRGIIDLAQEIPEQELYFLREIDIEKEGYYFVQPGSFVLAQSLEYVAIPNYICSKLGGRSSLAKSGVEVHATAGRVDPGFKGHLTFELKNAGRMPVKLYPLQRVAHLMFELTAEVESEYKGVFQYQVRIKPPKPDADLIRYLGQLGQRRATV
ncbi:dCTP deaminase, dUMP-forming [subsurface metagenome]